MNQEILEGAWRFAVDGWTVMYCIAAYFILPAYLIGFFLFTLPDPDSWIRQWIRRRVKP